MAHFQDSAFSIRISNNLVYGFACKGRKFSALTKAGPQVAWHRPAFAMQDQSITGSCVAKNTNPE